MKRTRSGILVLEDNRLALIKRERGGRTYYAIPGGGVEAGESVEEAAVREAYEELGVRVRLERLAAIVEVNGNEQYYHIATVTGGQFGTGNGPEFQAVSQSERGSYTPMWVELQLVEGLDVKPRALGRALSSGELFQTGEILRFNADAEGTG